MIENVLDLVDHVLVMTVNPGFGGQAYIPTMTDKIRKVSVSPKEGMNGKSGSALSARHQQLNGNRRSLWPGSSPVATLNTPGTDFHPVARLLISA